MYEAPTNEEYFYFLPPFPCVQLASQPAAFYAEFSCESNLGIFKFLNKAPSNQFPTLIRTYLPTSYQLSSKVGLVVPYNRVSKLGHNHNPLRNMQMRHDRQDKKKKERIDTDCSAVRSTYPQKGAGFHSLFDPKLLAGYGFPFFTPFLKDPVRLFSSSSSSSLHKKAEFTL